MSGYGGQNWDDPYGPSSGWDPNGAYGQPYGYGPGHGPGYGPPGAPPYRSSVNGSAIAALVCNGLLVLSCCNVLAIPGVITSAIAVGRADKDPRSSRSLAIWSWVIFGAAIVLAIVFFAAMIIIDANTPDADPYYYNDTYGDGI